MGWLNRNDYCIVVFFAILFYNFFCCGPSSNFNPSYSNIIVSLGIQLTIVSEPSTIRFDNNQKKTDKKVLFVVVFLIWVKRL